MSTSPGQPDPSPFILRLTNEDAFHREAAAWTLGELGCRQAARPLAGLLLRELKSVERTGFLEHGDVVCAVAEAIRRIGGTDALYALVKALCVLSRARAIEEATVVEIVDTIGEVGGPTAVREATDRVVRAARERERHPPGLRIVGRVLLSRLTLCGDHAVATLRRVARRGPTDLRPIAERFCATV
jgi:hypothetical protein